MASLTNCSWTQTSVFLRMVVHSSRREQGEQGNCGVSHQDPMGWALPPSTSAQLAELIALTKALQLSWGKIVNMYTNSNYDLTCSYSALQRTTDSLQIVNYWRVMY
jgi:hypothetical protein